MNEQQINTLVWLLGRGASIACGLDWAESKEWQGLARDIRIKQIQEALKLEMQKIPLCKNEYHDLLSILSKDTETNWKHLLVTTNWDYLLQREILNLKLKILPNWLISSHVFHLNGSIEEAYQGNNNRSPFLLESDDPKIRINTLEVNQALNYMIWERLFIIIGMSFQCQMDKALLYYLHLIEDQLPFGEAKWIILDSEKEILDNTCRLFKKSFPAAIIIPINKKFQDWIKNGMPKLIEYGVIKTKEVLARPQDTKF